MPDKMKFNSYCSYWERIRTVGLSQALHKDKPMFCVLHSFILTRTSYVQDKLPMSVGVCKQLANCTISGFLCYIFFFRVIYIVISVSFIFFLCVNFISFCLLFARRIEKNTERWRT